MPRSAKATSIALAALSALRRGATGEVHSVFERTFNILIGEKLVGVARSGVSLSPIDLITDIPPSETMPALGVKKGMPIRVAGDRVQVDEVIEISLEGAKRWRPLTRVENPLDPEEIKRHLELAKRSAAGKGEREGLGQLLAYVDTISRGETPAAPELTEVAKAALPHVVNLVKAARLEDIAGVKNAAKNLIGLGPGLTPSADDLLSGFTSALCWTSRSLSKGANRVDKINEAILSQAGGTNLLSRQLLGHAARGEVNERLGELLEVLLAGPTSEIGPLVGRVMKIGETSGIDMMVGLLLGMGVGLEMINESLPNRLFSRTVLSS